MIPKRIHYCWLSEDPVPDTLQKCMETWQKKIPDYEFVKWDFKRFSKEQSIWVKEAFDNKKYAFAADYIRLYAVYNYGGIYLDMDIEVVKRLDDLLDSPYMFAYERENQNGLEAGCFGAEKKNPFIKDCLDYYENRHFVKEDGTFDTRPLPFIMKDCLDKKAYSYRIYDYNTFTAKSYETGIEKVTKNTYCIHHFAGSWKSEREQKVIQNTRKLQKNFGYKIARNIAEYTDAFSSHRFNGIWKLTKEKLQRKQNDR